MENWVRLVCHVPVEMLVTGIGGVTCSSFLFLKGFEAYVSVVGAWDGVTLEKEL